MEPRRSGYVTVSRPPVRPAPRVSRFGPIAEVAAAEELGASAARPHAVSSVASTNAPTRRLLTRITTQRDVWFPCSLARRGNGLHPNDCPAAA